jgi:hypothetical protein
MTEMRVSSWHKYGRDRLYVTTSAGAKVGWIDLRTRKTTLDQPELATEFLLAVIDYHNRPRGTAKPAAGSPRSPGAAARDSTESAPSHM